MVAIAATALPLMLSACGATGDNVSTTSVELPAVTDDSVPVGTVPTFQEPAVPGAGGSGLPELPGEGGSEEVDCDNAEDLCDSGEWACDDIADYCDIGPDGGELPDDWDWDQ